jgi:hypothetical protein
MKPNILAPVGIGCIYCCLLLKKRQQMNQELQPQEYLDKYEITTYLKDVLVKVLEDKPEDPFQYIAD